MTGWIDWQWLALAAPWFGAALIALTGLIAAAAVWARWQPSPDVEIGGLPPLLRWGPALALGCGCAALFCLATPRWELAARAGAAAATLAALTGLCAFGLGRAGDHAVRLLMETIFWKQHADTVAMRLRHLLKKDQMLAYAAKSILTELEASSLRLFLLDQTEFRMVASLPSSPLHPGHFDRDGLLAQAFNPPHRVPFLEVFNPTTGRPGNWVKRLMEVDPAELQGELESLSSFEAQAAVGFWRESKLAGFFLIGGRLTSDQLTPAQMHFTAEVADEVARMLDVLEALEKAERIRMEAEEIRRAHELAADLRRHVKPPEPVPLAEVAVEQAASSPLDAEEAQLLDELTAEMHEPALVAEARDELAVAEADPGPVDFEEAQLLHELAQELNETGLPPEPAPVAHVPDEAAVENAALVRVDSEEVRMVRELATQVRKRMTPPDVVSVAGMEYGVAVEIAEGSQGRFCDVVALSGASLGIVMAECESSGVRVAVEMVRLQALLRSRFYVCGDDLRQALDSVEKALLDSGDAQQPVRLLMARYNAISRRLLYVNAGHVPPVLLMYKTDGPQALRLTATGRPLSGEGRADWEVGEIELQRRDLLLALSPGLLDGPEAQSKWSENRLLATLLDLETQAAPGLAQSLVREALERSEDKQPESELSAIVLRPSEAGRRTQFMPSRHDSWGDYLRRA